MIRERLTHERKKRNKSRTETAYELGISEVYVRLLENGTANPGRDMMIRISKYYGLEVDVLFPDLFAAINDKEIIKNDGRN